MGRQGERLPGEERRRRVIKAARRLFTDQGYDGTSMDDVAKAAGCTKGPVYYFFGSKPDLYLATLRATTDNLLRVATQRRTGTSPLGNLVAWCERILAALSTPEAVRFAVEGPVVAGPICDEIYRAALVPIIANDLNEAITVGEIAPDDVESLADVIAGMLLHAAQSSGRTSGDPKKAAARTQIILGFIRRLAVESSDPTSLGRGTSRVGATDRERRPSRHPAASDTGRRPRGRA